MLVEPGPDAAAAPAAAAPPACPPGAARVALLSNPTASGNRALLPQIRAFCAVQRDIFHYEVERVDQIGTAMARIARVKPRVLVINGGDGTVQAALTEIHNGRHFGDEPPPVAVLPNGKTNLIAMDLGADGDPLQTLEQVLAIARSDMKRHIVARELIALSDGSAMGRTVLGMFLGGAGLADIMLYCRHRIYPLGLPNGFSHVLAFLVGFVANIFGLKNGLFPKRPDPIEVSVTRHGRLQGRFAVLVVTTLERLILHGEMPGRRERSGALQLIAVERRPLAVLRVVVGSLLGRLGKQRFGGVHVERGDEIRIEADRSSVILDGELFEASRSRPIVLRRTGPVSFLRLFAPAV
ncbi:MAG: diacylglycerol kinase [Alphaproteobacteria bacterium]|nr:diacylglycerol kinase [Alphaproteobacteria bacterium]